MMVLTGASFREPSSLLKCVTPGVGPFERNWIPPRTFRHAKVFA